MNNKVHGSPNPLRAALEEAARWFLRLQEKSAHAETFLKWQQWLSASHAHRTAYEEIEDTVLRLTRSGARPPLPSAEEMAADTYDGSIGLSEWKRRDAPATPSNKVRIHRRWWRYAMAAGLAACCAVGTVLWLQHARDIRVGSFAYRTASGQRQAVNLPDGSKVTLDADSALQVRLERNSRALTLEHGEAFFEVAKDRSRPFVVRAGATEVTAVGTAFNVRMGSNRTVVAVTEGKVEVATASKTAPPPGSAPSSREPTAPRLTAQVSAGEAVSYMDDGNLQALPAAQAPLAIRWLEGMRQYRNEPLRYVLADVDRYTGQKIELADESVGDLRFTGTLDLKNSATWLRGLSVALPVVVSAKEDGSLQVRLR